MRRRRDVYSRRARELPPAPVERPCGRCGHAFDQHDHDFGGAGCMHHVRWPSVVACACAQWVAPGEYAAEVSDLRADAACQDDCLCRAAHSPSAVYYVTCCRDPKMAAVALLLGPFRSHAVALGFVESATRAAERVDPNAVWYAYGTTAFTASVSTPGKLNTLVLM